MRRSKEWEGNLDAFQKEAVRLGLGHIATEYGMNQLTQAIGNHLFPDELNPKPIQSVTSLDPNAIYGPSGPTQRQYLRRAALGSITIGGKTYLVEPDRAEYFRDIDLRPAKNLIVRVNAHFDSSGRGKETLGTEKLVILK